MAMENFVLNISFELAGLPLPSCGEGQLEK
jgi:hypothetical protein